jgi:hypothetical protein
VARRDETARISTDQAIVPAMRCYDSLDLASKVRQLTPDAGPAHRKERPERDQGTAH